MNTLARTLLSLSAATLLSAACATQEPPAPYSRESTERLTATVAAIDYDKRLITLQGSDPEVKQTIEAGPEVRNFPQIKQGDLVVVEYYQGVAAEVQPPGTVAAEPQAAIGTTRTPEGSTPGAAVGSVVSSTVTIQSYDKKTNMVTFSRPDGLVRVMKIEDPKAQEFASKLKKGDQVEVTFTEALAVSVEPQSK
jgi:Cu/Ag efflux protein CusF